ncbi:hypothetical protein WJX68_24275, partial [Pseudonocardia sp. DW16-2]
MDTPRRRGAADSRGTEVLDSLVPRRLRRRYADDLPGDAPDERPGDRAPADPPSAGPAALGEPPGAEPPTGRPGAGPADHEP